MPADRPLVMGIRPYRPDLPTFSAGASSYVKNVLPQTPQSYGPLSDLSRYAASALSARCQGATAVQDTSATTYLFSGTATDLYRLTSGGTAWSNVSKSAGVYNLASEQFWSFAKFKDTLIATNIADPIQKFVISTDSAFSDLSSAAPKAKYAAGIKYWLMVANTNDPIGGDAPWRVWWSAINDATNWPTPGGDSAAAVQSDYTDIIGENGVITGLVGNLGTSDGAVFFEHAVWRVVYVGPPAVFDFFPAQGVKGTRAPNSIVQVGAVVYYLGEDGFYVFDGTNAVPIGVNKIDKTFYDDMLSTYINRIVGAYDPLNKMVFWGYPGVGSQAGSPNKMVIYNTVTNEWSYAELACEFLFRALGLGTTLDGLDSLGYTMETLPFSLDSAVWVGGQTTLGVFDTSHYLSFFTGSNLEATIDCEEIQPFNGQRSFVRNTRPIVDGGTPQVSIGTRETLEASVSFNNPTSMNTLGWCPQRASGRYTRARATIPAGTTWTHFQGVELDADPSGVR